MRASDVAYRLVDGEALIVSATQGRIVSLNPVGAYVWERANGNSSAKEIAAMLTTDFEVDAARAETDVVDFVSDLVSRGLMSWSAEAV